MNNHFTRRPADLAAAQRDFFADLARRRGVRPLVLWGAGRAGEIALAHLRAAGQAPAWIADRNEARSGSVLNGVPIASPAQMCPPSCGALGEFVVLSSMHSAEMAAALKTRGWREERDFCIFPSASIYHPAFGFLLRKFASQPSMGVRSPRAGMQPLVRPRVTVLASSQGNFFFRELRDFLVRGLQRLGWTAVGADETTEQVMGIPIIVGPHEFFSLGRGVEWFSDDNLASAVLVGTEQPQSLWCREFVPVYARAGAVLDISPNGTEAWREHGIAAAWLPLGWYAGCDPFDQIPTGLLRSAGDLGEFPAGALASEGDDVWADRPIDVLFIGAHSPRRERALGELRAVLPGLNWFVHLPSDRVPLTAGTGAISSAEFVALSRQAKVLLNIHRDEAPFWEWQRIVWRGLWQRTLVVTESTGAVAPPLLAGRDFVEAPLSGIAQALVGFLANADGATRADAIRVAGVKTAREALPFALTAERIAAACAHLPET